MIIIVADVIVIYLITKKVSITVTLTVVTNIVSTILYFLHERLWDHIKWGRLEAK